MQQEVARQLATLSQPQRSYVLGMIGASLLRDWYEGGEEQAARFSDLVAAVRVLDQASSAPDESPVEVSVNDGYSEWADSYDQPNAMIQAEESTVRSLLLKRIRPGSAILDAGCGTGRHAVWLTARGFRAIGIDRTEAMLRHATTSAPRTPFVQADIETLPISSDSVDAAVCSLALCHFPDLGPALRELARVLRPGGHLIVSDPHGRAAYAGGQGFYGVGGLARRRFIRNYYRQASEWIQGFTESGFAVESCHEPRMDAAAARAHPIAGYFPDAALAALLGVPHLWIWSVIRRHD
ncbi:class I SAM-dependent methyltransferase [Amycolatopsis sp. NBC_00438]|uniref:class I SAM-dependent methyltransferase n=1 Tax=Amycolatopsis sp. NBC_00438 TaxID=2903558 RepID=UPI002E248DD7